MRPGVAAQTWTVSEFWLFQAPQEQTWSAAPTVLVGNVEHVIVPRHVLSAWHTSGSPEWSIMAHLRSLWGRLRPP